MTLVLFIFINLLFFCPMMILCIKIEISQNDFYNSLGFHFHKKKATTGSLVTTTFQPFAVQNSLNSRFLTGCQAICREKYGGFNSMVN